MKTLSSINLKTSAESLRVHNLWKMYGNSTVVENLNFTLNSGEIVGLLGPNGAGKTTTVGMLYGSVAPSRGFVKLGSIRINENGRMVRAKMGIVAQENNLDLDLSVIENLVYFAHHYRILGRDARKRAKEVLTQLDLQDYARCDVKNLSGGMQRRLVLARALINYPKVVFLDEPTTGLDPDARQQFWKIVINLKQKGCGVLLTTHYMDEAQRLCDQLLLLQKGKVIDRGTPSEMIESNVGREVIEIDGVNESLFKTFVAQSDVLWWRPFGSGYLLGLPPNNTQIWEQLVATKPQRLTRRQGNLEDVFLHLTGAALQ